MTKHNEYRFQFNHDEASCMALATMIKANWTVVGFRVEDGYTWLILDKMEYFGGEVEDAP